MTTTDLNGVIPAIIARHLPGRKITAVNDRGEWVRRIFEITLDTEQVVLIKFMTHLEWLDSTTHASVVCDLLRARGLSVPEILAVDTSKTLAPYPYSLEYKTPGLRLDRLLQAGLSEANRAAVFQAVGRYYRAMHSIAGPKQGVWVDDPAQPFSLTPNDFFLQNELENGAGRKLAEAGQLPAELWQRAILVWREHLSELNSQPPAMVHGSPFHWTVYLEQQPAVPGGWQVSHLASLGDVLWWDPAFDLAAFCWPPFAESSLLDWQAFQVGYGPLPTGAQRRMLLYSILQRIMAAAGQYLEPQTAAHADWQRRALDGLETLLEEIEAS